MIRSRDLIRKEMNMSHTYRIDLHIDYESYFLYQSMVIYCKIPSKWLWTDLSKKKAQDPSEKKAQLLKYYFGTPTNATVYNFRSEVQTLKFRV